MPALTDQTLPGSYPVIITAVISENSGLVYLTQTTTFNVILSDPCMTTVISLSSSSFPDFIAYINQVYSNNPLPVYSDTVSKAHPNLASGNVCGLSVVTQISKPTPSAAVNWFWN